MKPTTLWSICSGMLFVLMCSSTVIAQNLPSPDQVLPQLMFRTQNKPHALLMQNGQYALERTIFRDPLSHTEVWKLTHDPGMMIRPYYDIPFWNADGSCMLLEGWRNNGHAAYFMDADGSNLRPIEIPGRDASRMGVSSLYWSCKDPDILFFSESRDGKSWIMAFDKSRGTVNEITWYDGEGYRLFPPHPTEEAFLLTRGRQDQSGVEAVLAFRDPSKNRPIPISRESYHRVRFTKGDDLSVFFNSNDVPAASYFIHADGTGLTTLRGAAPEEWDRRGQHPDFSYDGQFFSEVENGYIEIRDRKGTLLKKIARVNGGHGSFTYGDQYHVWQQAAGTRPEDQPYEGEVIMISCNDIPKIWRIAKHYAIQAGWGHGHPFTESTHVDPTASMDLSKIGYMTDMCGQFADIYIAVVMLPDPPQQVAVRRTGTSADLTWELPAKHVETKGYHIYRSTTSGRGFERVNTALVTDRRYSDTGLETGRPYYYFVAAQEHSGLQGRPSAEVCASTGTEWSGPAVVDAEIELGIRDANMIDDFDGRFSNNFHVKLRPNRKDGTVTLNVTVPKTGNYTLHTLSKTLIGRANYWIQVDKEPEDLVLYKEPVRAHDLGFNWTTATRTYRLTKGAHTVRYRVNSEVVLLDKLVLSDDAAYNLQGDGRRDATPPAAPGAGASETLGLWTLGLTWKPSPDLDLRYYNVYSSREPDFPCDQHHLVLSPAEPRMIDWGLQPSGFRYTGTTYYYRVTAVDYAGNESAPSPVFEGRIIQPEGKPTTLEY